MASNGMAIRRRGGHVVFIALIVGHGLLLSSQVTTPKGHSALQSAILSVFAPLQRGCEGDRERRSLRVVRVRRPESGA